MCDDNCLEAENKNTEYSQKIEINICDMVPVVTALMRAGYQCLLSQDGESNNILIIEYLHPEYTGRCFSEVEF